MSDTLDPLDPSPYKVLNVPKDANISQIRSVYRKLVLVTHPDKVQDEAAKKIKSEQFHQIQQAYEILSDENRRRRWDDRSKLAELRAELAEERGPLRRAQTFAAPAPQGPMFEMRGGRMYEERVPKSAAMYEEDSFAASFRAETARPSRKYGDRFDEPPSRKTSGRGPEERRKYAVDEDEDYYERKAKEKRQRDEVRSAQNEKQKQRDKARKKDSEAKFSSKKAHVEDDMSDSDVDDRHYSSKSDSKSKRKEDEKKRAREPTRRNGKKTAGLADPELERKMSDIKDYMSKSGQTSDDRRRTGRSRADSYQKANYPSPPLTPTDKDYGRRSSGDDGRRSAARARANNKPPSPVRKSSKNKKNIEIVDSPPRRPSLPTASSERGGGKDRPSSSSKREPVRSATFTPDSRSSKKPPPPGPGLTRADTAPINLMRQATDPRMTSSKLKKSTTPSKFDVSSDTSASDSDSDLDSDSDSEPEPPPLPRRPAVGRQFSKVNYKVSQSEAGRIFAETEGPSRSRDTSPKGHRRSRDHHDRTTRTPPTRAATFQERPSPRNHEPSRSGSYRHVSPLQTSTSYRDSRERPLFGEMDPDSSPKGSPKVYADDRFRTPPYSRRGSEDIDRDAYPGSMNKSQRHGKYRPAEVRV